MGEQNVVKISEPQDQAVKDAEKEKAKDQTQASQRRVSELVTMTLKIAVERLAAVDRDPILRDAVVRMAIRDFAKALTEHFPERRAALPEYFSSVATELPSAAAVNDVNAAKSRQAGGSANAEYNRSSGKSGG
ncbi:MAG: hypothetical protein AAF367_02725 [Pseudomonadota bacterium]